MTKKKIYFSCLVLINQARLEHNSKSPLYSPIIGLFWNCFFFILSKNNLKKLPAETIRLVCCHKQSQFSTLPFSMTNVLCSFSFTENFFSRNKHSSILIKQATRNLLTRVGQFSVIKPAYNSVFVAALHLT